MAGVDQATIDLFEAKRKASWNTLYKYGLSAEPNTQLAYAIMAIKNELIYNGFSEGIISDTPVFGNFARDRTQDFQRSQGLQADGVVGPTTARVLFRKRSKHAELIYHIPNEYISRTKTFESNNDPNAQGSITPHDHGLLQVNSDAHPEISLAKAIDPAFVILWAAEQFARTYSGGLPDWDGVLVAWNQGTYWAGQWVRAGKPTHGGPTYSLKGVIYDRWVVATHYKTLVRQMPV